MGTGYKGNASYHRSIGQNLLLVSAEYGYSNGRFGTNSPHGKKDTRNIASGDNLATATDFYNKIAYGGIEQVVNENLSITRMADGTIISMRKKSNSDGTPAIDINIKGSSGSAGIKNQKIHFTLEE